jgi:hypothetical protein
MFPAWAGLFIGRAAMVHCPPPWKKQPVGNVPFTVYDALGYLSAGAILLTAATIALVGELPTEQTLATAVGIAIASYIVGHIISSLAVWALDRGLFGDGWGMGRPEKVLFGENVASAPWRVIFRRYYQALPDPIKQRVMDKAEAESLAGLDKEHYSSGLLAHCEAVVQRHPNFAPRIDRYEMLTTFLRNSSTAFALAAIVLFLAPAEHAIRLETARGGTTTLTPDLLAGLSLLAAGVLLFRYVQLFAEWRRRIFVLYAEAD